MSRPISLIGAKAREFQASEIFFVCLTGRPTVRLRKRAFACGLLRREGSRLTFGVGDRAAAAGKPGDAGGEDEGEEHYGCCEAESDTLDEVAVGNCKDRLLRGGLRCLIGRPGPISAE